MSLILLLEEKINVKCLENVSDQKKKVLQADLCRIKGETELITLQKEKTSLYI